MLFGAGAPRTGAKASYEKKITRNQKTGMEDRTGMFGDHIETDFSRVFSMKKMNSSWYWT